MSRAKSKQKKDFNRKSRFHRYKEQQTEVRKYVFRCSWHDRVITEDICMNTTEDIMKHLKVMFGDDLVITDPWEDRGLVLVTSLVYSFYQNMMNLPAYPTWALE